MLLQSLHCLPKIVASILEFRSQQHINQVYNLISSFEAHLCICIDILKSKKVHYLESHTICYQGWNPWFLKKKKEYFGPEISTKFKCNITTPFGHLWPTVISTFTCFFIVYLYAIVLSYEYHDISSLTITSSFK